MEKVLEELKNKRILALVGIIFMFLGNILPYLIISVSFFGYSSSSSFSLWYFVEGKILLFLTIAHLAFLFKDFIGKYIPEKFQNNMVKKIMNLNNPKLSTIPTAITILLMVILHFRIVQQGAGFIKYGVGFYFLLIGVICLIAHSFVYKGKALNTNVQNNAQPNMNNANTQPNMNNMNNVNTQPDMNNMNNVNVQPDMNNMNNVNVQPDMNNMNNVNVQPNMNNMNNVNVQPDMNNMNNVNTQPDMNNMNNVSTQPDLNNQNGINSTNNINNTNN